MYGGPSGAARRRTAGAEDRPKSDTAIANIKDLLLIKIVEMQARARTIVDRRGGTSAEMVAR